MVKYNGKDITQEEFDKIVADMASTLKIADGYEKKVKDLEGKVTELDKLGDLQSQLKAKEDELFKIKLNSRLSKISAFLESKKNDTTLVKRIGEMDDALFEEYIEGKTDADYKAKQDIEFAKTELEKKEKELLDNKDNIIKDALKQLNKDQKTQFDQKLVPEGEVKDMDMNSDKDTSEFPDIKAIKDLYFEGGNALYDRTPEMETKAMAYLKRVANLTNQ
jgi:hypothetical protein